MRLRLRLRLSLYNRTGLSKCDHSEGQGPTELDLVEVEVEQNKYKKNISCLSKVVLVVVHGQNCMVNENCLYKAILKILFHKYLCVPCASTFILMRHQKET